jgi:hypothetical protein
MILTIAANIGCIFRPGIVEYNSKCAINSSVISITCKMLEKICSNFSFGTKTSSVSLACFKGS